jgi:transcriptional regulator with GAF, ATPase, and Fis domain
VQVRDRKEQGGDRDGESMEADHRQHRGSGAARFLDEVGEMPLVTQPKLLRVLEQHTVTRVGDSAEVAVRARVVTATNRD